MTKFALKRFLRESISLMSALAHGDIAFFWEKISFRSPIILVSDWDANLLIMRKEFNRTAKDSDARLEELYAPLPRNDFDAWLKRAEMVGRINRQQSQFMSKVQVYQ